LSLFTDPYVNSLSDIEMRSSKNSHRVIIASLFFLLAVLIAFYGLSYYYLMSKYPTSIHDIKQSLNSPTVTKTFSVEEAKKEGYSENEIAEYLSEMNIKKLQEYRNHILFIETVVFIVSSLIALGVIILISNINREKIK
jgi:hypothetical protein